MKLIDKTAIITGGSSGIGLETARLFNKEGAKVIITGRNEEKLEKAKNLIGENVITFKMDVAKVEDIYKLKKFLLEENIKLDILFGNAGMSECPSIFETDEKFFDEIINTNLKSNFFIFTNLFELLNDNSSVIFTSSVSHDMGVPGDPLYSASKAALRSLVRTFAADESVLNKKIRVNAISPGPIKTPLTEQDNKEMQKLIDEYIENTVPMKRWGEAEEVAKAVLFLASDDSSYMTASEIRVDGGLSEI
ncbi:SDR family oxidoreductase [Clostridium thermobutyricum]|uniref:3-oxoacyl-[acyl-carrier-protein] reductase FabG n=1 Tax=Clostridium thermobutyricum DSM 4928 TaxID=1121339 RepID=A0A1V4SVM6_9CLOT|nr:SDR family oxidoreductase [Clostridium thermobutyricum]OPX47358.1 3-oxoacyl-[acyl-carrier-protein] reductase FabG [Clostridium thermobutyricum DSM 4928]